MPPKCPSCGRFLSNDLVQGLLAEPATCPRCERTLTADDFHGSEVLQHAPEPLAESVRPPDLPPETVRPRDVLEGWDEAPAAEVVALRSPRVAPGGATGAVLAIVAAGVLGGLLGGLSAGRHRRLGAVVGTLLGAAGAALGLRRPGAPTSRP